MRVDRGEFAALLGAVLFGLLAIPAAVHARTCEMALWLDDSVTVGALQFDVGYSAVAGAFATGPQGIACASDADNALVIFGDDAAVRVLTTSVLSLAGVVGPQKLAHCFFNDPHGAATSSAFVVVVTDATDLGSNSIVHPQVTVRLPNCGDETTTTTSTTTSTSTTLTTTTSTTSTSTSTTSTTSTTLAYCGNGVVDDDEQCDDGNVEPDDGCEPDCTADIICGDANGNDTVQASDALLVLRAAVGQPVVCPFEVCDTDGDSVLRTSDSLRVLKRAVGQSVVMNCPPAP